MKGGYLWVHFQSFSIFQISAYIPNRYEASVDDIQQISFIDAFNRTIFNAQELGYTAESLFNRFKPRKVSPSKIGTSKANDTLKGPESIEQFKMEISLNILKSLLADESTGPDLDPAFSRKKRKKKRKP